MPRLMLTLSCVAILVCAPTLRAQGAADAYLAGYARALLEHAPEVRARGCQVSARAGWVVVRCVGPGAPARARLAELLADVPGYIGLEVDIAEPPPAGSAPLAAGRTAAGLAAAAHAPGPRGRWFPRDALFEPLVADPREPRFFVSARAYDTDIATGWFTEVGYGENFGLYRRGDWQVGISGGLFGLFDLESESFDLINADYTVGVPLSWRRGASSGRLRLYHQSSHLGDEFLLRAAPERVNLSFESLELLLARDIGGLRAYGGGEVLLHREPANLGRLMAHGGLEYLSQTRVALLPGLYARPVAGLDLKAYQEHDWSADVSAKIGWQFDAGDAGRLVRVLLEAFRGNSPHGQFYQDRIHYLGVSVAFGL